MGGRASGKGGRGEPGVAQSKEYVSVLDRGAAKDIRDDIVNEIMAENDMTRKEAKEYFEAIEARVRAGVAGDELKYMGTKNPGSAYKVAQNLANKIKGKTVRNSATMYSGVPAGSALHQQIRSAMAGGLKNSAASLQGLVGSQFSFNRPVHPGFALSPVQKLAKSRNYVKSNIVVEYKVPSGAAGVYTATQKAGTRGMYVPLSTTGTVSSVRRVGKKIIVGVSINK